VDEPSISYEYLVERALRSVLREALTMTRDSGLPGQHHFYITFRTAHPGVQMPARLKALHPDDMTIVLQHQFWNLTVEPEWFSVELGFGGQRELLHIPFDAVTAFADPHAKFGLQFQIDMDGDLEGLFDDDDESSLEDLFPDDDTEAENDSDLPSDGKPTAVPAADGDGKVVTLDAFRKK
jgi:hypothetical protein